VTTRRKGFEELCREEFSTLVRTAYLMTGDREEALDLAQEALARAYQRWNHVSGLERPGAWLQRVVANLAISWRRRQRARARAVMPSRTQYDLPATPDPELMSALRVLPPAQRAVIVLRYYVDQSVEEVARTLNKRPGTVRALTAQGLARLRELLAPKGVRADG
jgi:RNA polymerase sigma-70 factor (sigma-E family)